MTIQLSRRNFLKTLALTAASFGLGNVGRRAPLKSIAQADPPLIPRAFLPLIYRNDNSLWGRVIHIQNLQATASWNGEANYWEYVNQSAVDGMVDRGVTELTGAATRADAWSRLLPSFQPGQKVAIKINLNNSRSCGTPNTVIDALIQPVNAVVKGLEEIGVLRQDISVYDAVRAIPQRLILGGLSGIQFFDDGCNNAAGFSSASDAYIPFEPPAGMTMPSERVSNALVDAAYLINMPIMKGGHPLANVTLGLKNHFGTIHNCAALHNYVNVVGKPRGYTSTYNPLVDFLRSPHIGGKHVLTIGDALFAARAFSQKPQPWTTFDNKVPNSLFFATDPVAVDCVMHDFIGAEVGPLVTDSNRYLQLAAEAGFGEYESVDPWTEAYSLIQYSRVNL